MTGRGHGGFVGLRYLGHGDDWIEIALPWRADLVGVSETGVLASGPIITLLDNATSMSVWVKSGAQPGDAVFLTKPLGTGLVLASRADLEEAARWMTTLNDRAAQVLRPFSPLSDGLRRTDTATREWVGLMIYRLAGRTNELFPAP